MGGIALLPAGVFFHQGAVSSLGRAEQWTALRDGHGLVATDAPLRRGWGHVPAYLAGYRWHQTSKGMTVWPKFVAENELIYTRYPEFAASSGKRLAGRCLYRGLQIASGRHIGAQLDTLRWRRRKVTDIFPR